MKTPQILTGQQAIDQFGLNALIECRVAVTTELNGLGHSVMQIGVIADPDSCQIDEDDTGVLWVEYQGADDWYLYSIPADEQFVLLDDKNPPKKCCDSKTPDQIYLIPDAEHGYIWCEDPAPGEGMLEEDATRYVREDLVPASNAVLSEQNPDDIAVDRFAAAMKAKLAAARAKGRSGWDDKSNCSGEHLAQLLVEHLSKGNTGTFEDIANFGMMLHQRGEDPKLLFIALATHIATMHVHATHCDEYEDGTTTQKAFWEGFERGALNGAANIRQHWNEYKQLRQQAKPSGTWLKDSNTHSNAKGGTNG